MDTGVETAVVEQRKHKRYRVNNMFAVPSSNPSRLCQIMDLSMGGLSFSYFNSQDWKTKSSKLNILLPDAGFCLDKLPIKSVADVCLDSPVASDTMRRSGVKFGRLKSTHTYWLEYLINKYGMDPTAIGLKLQACETASE